MVAEMDFRLLGEPIGCREVPGADGVFHLGPVMPGPVDDGLTILTNVGMPPDQHG